MFIWTFFSSRGFLTCPYFMHSSTSVTSSSVHSDVFSREGSVDLKLVIPIYLSMMLLKKYMVSLLRPKWSWKNGNWPRFCVTAHGVKTWSMPVMRYSIVHAMTFFLFIATKSVSLWMILGIFRIAIPMIFCEIEPHTTKTTRHWIAV